MTQQNHPRPFGRVETVVKKISPAMASAEKRLKKEEKKKQIKRTKRKNNHRGGGGGRKREDLFEDMD